VQELVREVRKEMATGNGGAGSGGGAEEQEELCFEVIATVLEIFGRMDSLVSPKSEILSLVASLTFLCSCKLILALSHWRQPGPHYLDLLCEDGGDSVRHNAYAQYECDLNSLGMRHTWPPCVLAVLDR
jgi:hypothetical protein